MIILDIETSGVEFVKHGIWQIGALDLNNPKRTFLDECRIDDSDSIAQESLDLGGIDEKYLRNKRKQSQKQLLEKFFKWCHTAHIKNFVCQNPQFDTGFIKTKAEKCGLAYPFHFRAFDLHTVASITYFHIHDRFMMREFKELKKSHSDMGLPNILKFCGMTDPRTTHNALEDCKLTAECFSRMVYRKKLLKEFNNYPIPTYLTKR